MCINRHVFYVNKRHTDSHNYNVICNVICNGVKLATKQKGRPRPVIYKTHNLHSDAGCYKIMDFN